MIYGPETLCQIKEGKHLYRSLEVHLFYISRCINQKYIIKMLEKHSDIHQRLKEIIDTSTATMNENSTLEIKDTHNKIKSVLLSVNFRTLQSNFDELLKNQAHFFRNYMKVFERGTGQ